MRDPARTDRDRLIQEERLQGGVEMGRLYPARFQILAIERAGEITMSSHELLAAPGRLFKREILEAMKRIVMDEGPHRPVLRNHFAGELDHAAQLHPSGFDVDRRVYRFHTSDPEFAPAGSESAPVAAVVRSGPKRLIGATPSASRVKTTITSAASSVWSKSA